MTSTFRHYTRLASIIALLVTAAACSSDSNPAGADGSNNNGGSGNNNSSVTNCTTQTNACLTALIDGAAFTGVVGTNFGSYSGGLLVLAGGDANYTLGFATFASGTGSITLPGSGINAGKNASLISTRNNQGWAASAGGGSGTVTVTSLTSTTIAGTFNFTVVPVAGTGATGNHSITNGSFFVRF